MIVAMELNADRDRRGGDRVQPIRRVRSSSRLRDMQRRLPDSPAAMVGMAGENGQTAVDLLEHDDADELVRQRQRAEGEGERGVVANRLIEPVGAADREN